MQLHGGTKDLSFVGANLTHISYGNSAGEIKFLYTLKYYQKRLGELAATLSEDEKNSVKDLTKQFFNQHSSTKNRILEIIPEWQRNYTIRKNSTTKKSLIDFDIEYVSSMKSLAIKKN